MARHVPEPGCQCGHGYGFHDGPGRCGYQEDREDPETRCRCPKFAVPRGRPGGRGGWVPVSPARPARGQHRRRWWR